MSFICQYCKKSYSRNTNLIKHQKTAKFCLQKQGILPPPPANTRQPAPKSPAPDQTEKRPLPEVIADACSKLTFINIKNAESYAKFAAELFKDHISIKRKVIEYIDNTGTVQDHSGHMVTKLFFEGIAATNKTLLDGEYKDIQRKVQQVAQEGRAGCVDITGMLTESTKIYDTKMSCEAIVRGEDNEFAREFIKYLYRFLGK